MSDEKLPPVRVYVALSTNHWGSGLAAETALREVKHAGASAAELKQGPKESKGVRMYRLPQGVVAFGVDGFGCVHWNMLKGVDASGLSAERLVFNKNTGKWETEP